MGAALLAPSVPPPGVQRAGIPEPIAAGFTVYVQLVSEDPARNRARVYQLVWQPDLWGGGALVRTWGRRGQPGVSRVSRYPDRPAAQVQISRLLRRRLQHGYTVVAWQ